MPLKGYVLKIHSKLFLSLRSPGKRMREEKQNQPRDELAVQLNSTALHALDSAWAR